MMSESIFMRSASLSFLKSPYLRLSNSFHANNPPSPQSLGVADVNVADLTWSDRSQVRSVLPNRAQLNGLYFAVGLLSRRATRSTLPYLGSCARTISLRLRGSVRCRSLTAFLRVFASLGPNLCWIIRRLLTCLVLVFSTRIGSPAVQFGGAPF
jgi:hypothetical protein